MGKGVLKTPLKNLAKTLLNTFGGTATVTRTSVTYAPLTGVETTSTTDTTVDAYPYPVESKDLTNSAVRATDSKFFIPAADISLTEQDIPRTKITYDGRVYLVVAMNVIDSGGVDAMYEVFGRRG